MDIRTAVDGKPTLLVLWATYVKPSIRALAAIAEHEQDWLKDFGVHVVAVATDDPKTADQVRPVVETQGWTFHVLLDPNGALQRALGLPVVPSFALVSANGTITSVHFDYAPGDVGKFEEDMKKLKP